MAQKTTITSSDFLPARFRSVFCSKHPGTPHSSAWQPLCQETCHTGNLCDKMNGAHANGRNAFFHFLLATSRHAEALACPDGSLALAIFFSCSVSFFASLFPFGFCLLHLIHRWVLLSACSCGVSTAEVELRYFARLDLRAAARRGSPVPGRCQE